MFYGEAIMRDPTPLPQRLDEPLEASLGARMAPSSSRVPDIYRETTKCYAYMCGYAYGCSERADRPAQVLMRRCMRYMPESLRIKPALSDLALDLLARQRQRGDPLSAGTRSVLDQLRPDGPIRRIPPGP